MDSDDALVLYVLLFGVFGPFALSIIFGQFLGVFGAFLGFILPYVLVFCFFYERFKG